MEKNSLLLKRRAGRGLLALGIRRVVIQLVLTGGNIVLARIFLPEIFGIFIIVNFIVTLFSIFTDIGLGQSLIQRKKTPTKETLQTIFTTQAALGIAVYLVLFFASSIFSYFYKTELGGKGEELMRLLGLMLIFSNLKTNSSSLLERELNYKRLSFAETLEVVLIQGTTVVLALHGLAATSFILGNLIGRLASFFVFFLLSPWPLGFAFSWKELKPLLPFGFHLQVNTFVGFLNATLVILYISKNPGPGGFSGAQAVGFLSWAGGIALATRAIAETIGRIVFPAIARSQDNKLMLKTFIERSLQFSCMISYPAIAILAALAAPLTYIVYTDKWLAGLPALYIFLGQSSLMILETVFTNTLLGLGKAKTVRNINLFIMLSQFALTVLFVNMMGFIGFAVASLISSLGIFFGIAMVKKAVAFSLLEYVVPYVLFSFFAGLTIYMLNYSIPVRTIWEMILYGAIGLATYGLLLFIFKRKDVLEDFAKVKMLMLTSS